MRARRFDWIRMVAIVFSVLTVATVCGIFLFLLAGSVEAWRHEGFSFLTKNHWAYRKQVFEAAAMIYGTAVVAAIAIILAVPVGFATAVFTSEMCGDRWRLTVKLIIELLAGVPSVVYGLLGVLFLRNWMQELYDLANLDVYSGDTLLTAGVLLSIMVLPTICTLFDDAFRSVGSKYRDAARGLGLTRAETTFHVLVPQALPGLLGALLLSFGRALGETIAVFLVVGRADNRLPKAGEILHSLVDAGQTITSKLGGAETNIAVGDKLHSSAMLGLALVLFVAVVGLTIVADVVRSRWSGEAAR